MNPSTAKQPEVKPVPPKVTTEATNATSTKEQVTASKSELESVVKVPVDSSTSKQQDVKLVPTKVAAETSIAPTEVDKPVLASHVLASFLNDRTSAIEGSSRYTTAREPNSKISIVNHKNSNRCKINLAIQEKLNLIEGDVVQVIVKDKMVLLLKSPNEKGIVMKEHGNLYSKELVERVTDMFKFDFSQQSTHHLTEVTFQKWNEQLVAILTP